MLQIHTKKIFLHIFYTFFKRLYKNIVEFTGI